MVNVRMEGMLTPALRPDTFRIATCFKVSQLKKEAQQAAAGLFARSHVLGRHCCRAASGARAAGGPARRIGLPPVTWRPLIASRGTWRK